MKGGQLRTLWRQDGGAQCLQEQTQLFKCNETEQNNHCFKMCVCLLVYLCVRVQDKTGNEGSPLFSPTASENTLVCRGYTEGQEAPCEAALVDSNKESRGACHACENSTNCFSVFSLVVS